MVRIGLLGCGNVGRIIATHQEGFEVVAVFDQMPDHAEALAQLTGAVPHSDFEAFLDAKIPIVPVPQYKSTTVSFSFISAYSIALSYST